MLGLYEIARLGVVTRHRLDSCLHDYTVTNYGLVNESNLVTSVEASLIHTRCLTATN